MNGELLDFKKKNELCFSLKPVMVAVPFSRDASEDDRS